MRKGRGRFYEVLMTRGRVLITGLGRGGGRLAHEQVGFSGRQEVMMDLVYIGVVVLFFVVAGLYVRLCEKM
jgi:hypothetical protein